MIKSDAWRKTLFIKLSMMSTLHRLDRRFFSMEKYLHEQN